MQKIGCFIIQDPLINFSRWETNSEEQIPQGEADESCMPGVLVTVRTQTISMEPCGCKVDDRQQVLRVAVHVEDRRPDFISSTR